jgi:hypothetical protein
VVLARRLRPRVRASCHPQGHPDRVPSAVGPAAGPGVTGMTPPWGRGGWDGCQRSLVGRGRECKTVAGVGGGVGAGAASAAGAGLHGHARAGPLGHVARISGNYDIRAYRVYMIYAHIRYI